MGSQNGLILKNNVSQLKLYKTISTPVEVSNNGKRIDRRKVDKVKINFMLLL